MPDDIKAALWKAADQLRAQVDAAEYKHIVLGLIFLKYISDRFDAQREKIRETVSDSGSEYFVGKQYEDYAEILEDRDYYIQDNVFWVPKKARWEKLREQAKQPGIGAIIDDAIDAIEKENPFLRGKLDKRFGRMQLEQGALGKLIDLISTIEFGDKYHKGGDLLGEVYEYFLGQFAAAEGKRGGQFYTPAHIVKTLVEVLAPTIGRVYDPCCGSGGMFVQSEKFVQAHDGGKDDISIYGQESNPTTWRLAAMNLAIRGFAANLGHEPADTFARDQFPDMKFDYIMANPPFNISDWGGERYENDKRWKYGRPPESNANYAWLQHILWKLNLGGRAGVVLANGSMSSSAVGERQIREAMVRANVVEAMVALPGQLFINTAIPACLWFLVNRKTSNTKKKNNMGGGGDKILFVDARNLGRMETRVRRILTDENVAEIAGTVHKWRIGKGYKDVAGFCRAVHLAEIEQNDFVLTPGRYVGMAESDADEESFTEKMAQLTVTLHQQVKQGEALNKAIIKNLAALGYKK